VYNSVYCIRRQHRIQLSHRNFNAFLTRLQNVTVDNTSDRQRVRRGLDIHCTPSEEQNPQNDTLIKSCVAHYDACSYTKLQFLREISHCRLDIHSATFLAETTSDENGVNGDHQQQQQTESTASSSEAADATSTQSATFCDVYLVAPRHDVVLASAVCSLTFLRPVCRHCSRDADQLSCMSLENRHGYARVMVIPLLWTEIHIWNYLFIYQ